MPARSLFFIYLFLSSFSTTAENIISDDSIEVVYFQSFHCAACYEVDGYLSAWDAINKNIRLRRVPVFSGENWEFGARLFFILEQSKSKYPLTSFERRRAAYSIVNKTEKEPVGKLGMMRVLKEYGMVFSVYEFSEWWKVSELMLEDTRQILSEVRNENKSISVPFLRVSKGESFAYIDASNPNYAIKALNTEVSRSETY